MKDVTFIVAVSCVGDGSSKSINNEFSNGDVINYHAMESYGIDAFLRDVADGIT